MADFDGSSEWSELHHELSAFLSKWGRSSPFGEGDYWLLDDNWGNGEHLVYIYKENYLTPALVQGIKEIIKRFPRWKVVISMDIGAQTNEKIPPMGLVISSERVQDDLNREFLAGSLKNVRFM